jgi:hypothetical protein
MQNPKPALVGPRAASKNLSKKQILHAQRDLAGHSSRLSVGVCRFRPFLPRRQPPFTARFTNDCCVLHFGPRQPS